MSPKPAETFVHYPRRENVNPPWGGKKILQSVEESGAPSIIRAASWINQNELIATRHLPRKLLNNHFRVITSQYGKKKKISRITQNNKNSNNNKNNSGTLYNMRWNIFYGTFLKIWCFFKCIICSRFKLSMCKIKNLKMNI